MLKTKILKILEDTNEYISGQQLCEEFSVSRTAIWKVINKLKEEGYQIESVPNKGYRLHLAPDRLSKSELVNHLNTKWLGQQIYAFEEIGSTNVFAKELGEKGSPHGTIVVAESQTEGRGRRGRSWESPPGSSISISILLRPDISPEKASMLTMIMALAVVRGIKEITGETTKIKWPNDILCNQKKICGILTEMSAELDMIHYVVIGVGINVNMDELPKEQAPYASSLKAELGHTYLRVDLIGAILRSFEGLFAEFLESENLERFKKEYNKNLVNRNQQVCILERNQEFTGTAVGISNTGELMVELENGQTKYVMSGEVSVRGIYGYV